MRHLLSLFVLTLFSLSIQAQFQNPISWSSDWKHLGGEDYELIFTGEIDPGWYTYSQFLESDEGPIATQIVLESGDHFELSGKSTEEGNIKEGFDNTFQMNVIKISGRAIFRQKIKLRDPSQAVKGYVTYMICNEEMCLPPTDYEFNLQLSPSGAASSGDEIAAVDIDEGALLSLNADGPKSPVQWEGKVEKIGDNTYKLQMVAHFDQPWTLYSQYIEEEGGPIPTTITYTEGAHYRLTGETEESGKKIKDGMDPVFEMVVKKITEGPAVFTQLVEVSDPNTPIMGDVYFMTCDDHQCMPPTYQFFKFDLVNLVGMVGTEPFGETTEPTTEADDAIQVLYGDMARPDLENPIGACQTGAAEVKKASIWKIFSLGFLGGLIALITPCVFPMIPLTVSFFTKRSHNSSKGISNALIYGGFIVLVYILLSVPFHLLSSVSPDVLNQISTNVWLNLAFFVIFLVFAFSFFGFYELTLPSSWTNRSSQAEGVGGMIGIFFMALTLALVSFSCTGPILGTLLVGALSSDGGAWQLTAGMGGFGLGLALPFGLFAAFPGFMSSLPKSGGWLNTVKVTLGFLELALALKFLSNADMVKHWGVLKLELFLGLWILIFAALALYLFGAFKFKGDSPVKKLPPWRAGLGAISAAFTLYLASGFMVNTQMNTFRPLKLLSGLAPPVCYSILKPCDCPQQLTCFKDLKEGLAYAKEVNKPVLLDFTGYACVNCRKMEEHVWPEKEVYPYLKDDYVLISLYVDDKKELPEEQKLRVNTFQGTKTLRTYGNKWSYFQETYFNAVAQPYYVLVTPDLQLLNSPAAYTPNKQEYASFLECGKTTFSSLALGEE